MERRDGKIYEFAGFRLIPGEGLLLHNDEQVLLAPKAFSTLVMLVEQHGHLVEKSELIERVWENTFVEEAAVSRCVWGIRNSLGEDPKNKKFIQTVPKRGYRFVGEVTEFYADNGNGTPEPRKPDAVRTLTRPSDQPVTGPATGSGIVVPFRMSRERTAVLPAPSMELDIIDKSKAPAPVTGGTASKKATPTLAVLFAASGIVLLFGAIGLGYYFFSTGRSALNVGDKKSIAVLPLKPINTANRDEIYEIGIADSLILKLGSMKGLVVRPLSATRKYADIEQDPIAAGKEQQVDYVLAANYQIAQGKIRITAQLFNVSTGRIEDTYKSERMAENVFAVQDAVAADIGNVLLARFGTVQTELVAKRGTENEEAYRLYLRARYLTESRMLSDSEKAVELSEAAVRLDPNYARAWAINAQAHVFKTLSSRRVDTRDENRQAMHSIENAMSLDPNLSDTYSVLCEAQRSYSWDFAAAERSCKRAIELDPMSALARQANTRLLTTLGRVEESMAEAKVAIDIEPASIIAQRHYGGTLYFGRSFDDAINHFLRTIELAPTTGTLNYGFLINSYAQKSDYPSAFEWFMKLKSVENTDQQTIEAYRSAYQSGGWKSVLNEDAKSFDEVDGTYYSGALLNADLDRKDKAFEYLERAFLRREWQCPWIMIEPRLDPLRNDPRFGEFVKRLQTK